MGHELTVAASMNVRVLERREIVGSCAEVSGLRPRLGPNHIARVAVQDGSYPLHAAPGVSNTKFLSVFTKKKPQNLMRNLTLKQRLKAAPGSASCYTASYICLLPISCHKFAPAVTELEVFER